MVPSITIDGVFKAVGDFLTEVLPAGTDVIRTQENRVAEPSSENFAMMTQSGRRRLSTNINTFDQTIDADTNLITTPTELSFQIDIHGPESYNNNHVVSSLWRDPFAVNFLRGTGVTPLHGDDGNQMPFINGEHQYEDRWVMTLVLQVNPAISTSLDFANSITPTIIEVDTTYPAGA